MALKLISAIYALKNNLKIVGYFLLGNLGLDILTQVFNHLYQPYPRPLMGLGFFFFALSVFGYLANGAWLMFCSSWSAHSITMRHCSVLALLSALALILVSYPAIIGASLLTVFFTYYIVIAVLCLVMIFLNLRKQLTISNGLMFMFNLGCLMEIFVVLSFGFQYYWLVNICNLIFYSVVLVVCSQFQKYTNLLKP